MIRGILVKSCQQFRARQAAIEATWAGELWRRPPQRLIYFLEGGQQTPSIIGRRLCVKTPDDYGSNSWKLREGLRMVLSLHPRVTHWFIVDDDTFVHPRRWLAHEPAGELECRLYHPRNEKQHSLNEGRPWAHGGAGWWMTRKMCQLFIAHVTRRTSQDDVLAAQVAQACGVDIIDRPDLYGGDEYEELQDRVGPSNSFITSHHIQPAEMLSLYEATRGI